MAVNRLWVRQFWTKWSDWQDFHLGHGQPDPPWSHWLHFSNPRSSLVSLLEYNYLRVPQRKESSLGWEYIFLYSLIEIERKIHYIKKPEQWEGNKNGKASSWFDGILGYQVRHSKTPDPISTEFICPAHNYCTTQLLITSPCCVPITLPSWEW